MEGAGTTTKEKYKSRMSHNGRQRSWSAGRSFFKRLNVNSCTRPGAKEHKLEGKEEHSSVVSPEEAEIAADGDNSKEEILSSEQNHHHRQQDNVVNTANRANEAVIDRLAEQKSEREEGRIEDEGGDKVATAEEDVVEVHGDRPSEAARDIARVNGCNVDISNMRSVFEDLAATRIQAHFRGHLAKRAFRALKGLVKLQALGRGRYVRRQEKLARSCMNSMANLQLRIKDRKKMMLSTTPEK